jgi:hypothetical protein
MMGDQFTSKEKSMRRATAIFALLVWAGSLAAQQSGFLKVKTTTGRAGVFIDDKYVGPAANFAVSRKYSVPAGAHTVTLREPRYESYTTQVTIVAGKTLVVKQDLKVLPPPKGPFGRLRTEGPDKFAAVYINGSYMGHVDEFDNFAQGLLLPPGQYTVKISPLTAGSELEQKVDVKANETVIVKVPGKA